MEQLRKLGETFGNWLSEHANPVLVKELRQGLRTKAFLGAFLAVQGVMQFSMLIAVASSLDTGASGMGGATAFFWFTVTVPLLILMPLRAAGSISGEQKANLLELVFLTRLTAWRTLWGKWLALFVQSLLVVIAVLPYTMMRYYLGGIDLLREVWILLTMLVVSGLLIAMETAQSAMKGGLIRGGALLFAILIGGSFFLGSGSFAPVSSAGSSFPALGLTILYLLIISGLIIVLLLEFGASYVAPQAENHSIRKRLMGFGILAISAGYCFLVPTAWLLGIIIGGAFYFLVLADGLCESLHSDVALYKKDRSPLRTLSNIFFSRGWVSALMLTLLTVALMTGLLYLNAPVGRAADHVLGYSGLFLGCLLFPPALNRLFSYKLSLELPMFILIEGIAVMVGFIAYMLDELTDIGFAGAATLLAPAFVSLMIVDYGGVPQPYHNAAIWGGNAVMLLILLLRAGQAVSALNRPAPMDDDHLTGDSGLLT